jgi:tetratricopeptide (TPR) repeat protein
MRKILGVQMSRGQRLGFWITAAFFGLATIVAVLLFLLSPSRRDVRTLKQDVSQMRGDIGRMMEYPDGLPTSTGLVRTSFDAGMAAMGAYKWDEAIGRFRDAIKYASGTQLIALYNLIGLCQYTPGRWNDALASFDEARRLSTDFNDKKGEAATLGNIGLMWLSKGQSDTASEFYGKALRLAEELDDLHVQAINLGNIGLVWQSKGKWDKALGYHEQALKLDRKLGDKQGEATDLCNIGLVWQDKGKLDKALEYHETALKLDQESGDKQGEAQDLGNIGIVWQFRVEWDKALEYYEKAWAIAHEIGDRRNEAGQLGNTGSALVGKGEYEKAVRPLTTALSMFLEIGAGDGPRQCRLLLGRCLKALGRERFVATCEQAGLSMPEAENLTDGLAKL